MTVGRRYWAVTVAGVVFAFVAESSTAGAHTAGVVVVADGVVGVALIAGGVVAWARRPESRIGPTIALSGFAWLSGTILSAALFWHRVPLIYAFLAHPTGRPSRRLTWVVIGLAFVDATVVPFARADWATIVVSVSVGAAAAHAFIRSSGPARRACAVALGSALLYSFALAVVALSSTLGWDLSSDATALGYDFVVLATAGAVEIDLLSGRWTMASVADLVVALGERGDVATLRGQLARAVGDRRLAIGYWLAERSAYVDDRGRELEVPDPDAAQTVTRIDDGAEPVAILVHDRSVAGDSHLLVEVARAAGLALANARLQAEARHRVELLAASRRRIVESADRERDVLERDLSTGAGRRLSDVIGLVDDARRLGDGHGAQLDTLFNDVVAARSELRDLAHGIRPPALRSGGLAAALPLLAERAPLPVTVTVPPVRVPAAIEAALYFVCSEALTNIAKHAAAATASVTVSFTGANVTATIVDDGIGGADPTRGTGLRGLADRVEALGGRLAIGASAVGGAAVTAEVPIVDNDVVTGS